MAWPRFNISCFWLNFIGFLSLRIRLLQGRIRSGWTISFLFISYGLIISGVSSILLFTSLFYPITMEFSGRPFCVFLISQLIAFPFMIFSHFCALSGLNLLSYVLICAKLNYIVVSQLISVVICFCLLCYIVRLVFIIVCYRNYNFFNHWRRVFIKFLRTRYHRINGSLSYHKSYRSLKDKRYFIFSWLQRIVLWLLVFYYIMPMFSIECQFAFFLLDVPVNFSILVNPVRFLLYLILFFWIYNNFYFLKDLYNSVKLNFYLLRLKAQHFDGSTTKEKGLKYYVLWFLNKFSLRKIGEKHRIIQTPTRFYLVSTFGFCKIERNAVEQTVIYSFDKSYLKQWDKLYPEYNFYGLSFYNLDRSFIGNLDFDWELFKDLSFIEITYESNYWMLADWLFEWDSSTCTADPNLISAQKYQELIERAAFGIAVHRHLTHTGNSRTYFRNSVKEYVQNVSLITHAGQFNQDPSTWVQFEPHSSHMREECLNYLFELAILRS